MLINPVNTQSAMTSSTCRHCEGGIRQGIAFEYGPIPIETSAGDENDPCISRGVRELKASVLKKLVLCGFELYCTCCDAIGFVGLSRGQLDLDQHRYMFLSDSDACVALVVVGVVVRHDCEPKEWYCKVRIVMDGSGIRLGIL